VILLCSISCSEVNGDCDCAGDDDSLIFNSIMCSYLSYKIRFEARERDSERERDSKDAEVKFIVIYVIEDILCSCYFNTWPQ
jgi:hypothetical protein